VDGIVKRQADQAISGVRRLHEELIKQASSQAGVNINYSFEGFNIDALEGMFTRRGIDVVNSFKTLQNSRISSALSGPLSDLIERGIKSGDWQETTRRIARLLSLGDAPDIKALQNIADEQGISLTELISARMEEIPDEVGFSEAMRRQMFNARRIAQTEIDVAIHEGERVAAERNPVNKGLKWQTSGRHSGLRSAPDVCDVFERYDFHGLGPGIYYPSTLPAKPHPFDGCTRLYVMRQPSEWGMDREDPVKPRMIQDPEVAQLMGSLVTSRSRDLTPRYISYTTSQANRYVQLAWQSWQQQQTQVA